VDPDNRRPVDFALRRRLLEELARAGSEAEPASISRALVEGWKDGRIKMQVMRTALALRNRLPAVFTGAYVPLAADGPAADHVMAFARVAEEEAVITVVPRLVATLTRARGFGVPRSSDWTGTRLVLPERLAGRYRDAFTGEEPVAGAARTIPVDLVLGGFPVALLVRRR
jgi:(1->4)-alpha-D-glucan 1-alpha-D-glucosylmutase